MTNETLPSQPNNDDGMAQMAKTEDARFLSFARAYVGLLTLIFAIPMLSSAFEVLPEPVDNAQLSVLSSFMSLIVFAACFLLRGRLKHWADAEDRQQYIPWVMIVISTIFSIIFIVLHLGVDTPNMIWNIATYLPIYPFLMFSLGIFLVTAFTQQQGHTIQSYIDAEPELKQQAPHILRMLRNYVAFRRLCEHNTILERIGHEFIEPQQKMLEFLREGRLEAGRHDAILVNGLLERPPMTGFHAVSDRDLEFWAHLEDDYMAREYFRLNQHMLERDGTMVTRVFILSDADLERTDVIVPILQQHQSTGIGWAIVIFDELNPTISNHQNKPLDFAFLTGTENQQEAGNKERIKAISYFRDYRETSRRYTVVFWTDDNNRKEIESQRDLYHSLFAHCWLASSSFKEIFACQSLFNKGEKDQVCEDVKFATDRLIARLESLPDNIRPQITWPPPKEKDQLFLREVSDVDEIRATICWLRDLRTAHRNWQDGETNTDCDT